MQGGARLGGWIAILYWWRSSVSGLCLQGTLLMVLLAGEASHGRQNCCFLWILKVTFGEFSGLCFACLGLESCWRSGVSELCLQGAFANGFASWRGISRAIELLFFIDSKGNVRRVFLACVLHALGSNPAGVRVFRNCTSKGHLPMVFPAGKASLFIVIRS